MSKREKKHFVLVHGASHGGWCWYKVATLLKSECHNVTCLDLAACGVNPKQSDEIGSISEYYEPLMEFMDSLPSHHKVILVAHSFGGVSVSVAMEKFTHKISLSVFVTAMMPGEELPFPIILQEVNTRLNSHTDTQVASDHGTEKPPTSRKYEPKFLESKCYQLSPAEDVTLALSLVRADPLFTDLELLREETQVTKLRYGKVPRIYIVCNRDNAIGEDLQRWMIERNPPSHVRVIDGSDHMPMFSKPLELCSLLLEFADMY